MTFRFKPLGPVELRYLMDSNHQREKAMYIDCLALMHDVLAGFDTTGEHPRFEDLNWIRSKAKASMATLEPHAASVKTNLTANLDSATNLYGELTSSSRTVTRFVAVSLVDDYLNDLLDQYRNLRYSRVP